MKRNTVDDYNYKLNKERIAIYPPKIRGSTRLMIVERSTGTVKHDYYTNLDDYIDNSYIIVRNNTKVFPARLLLKRLSNNKDYLFLFLTPPIAEGENTQRVQAITKGTKQFSIGEVFLFENTTPNLQFTLVDKDSDGTITFNVNSKLYSNTLITYGDIPIPPYLEREAEEIDNMRYNTEYSKDLGSSAAPTAGLNLTKELEYRLLKKDIDVYDITLHIGLGTFQPLRENTIQNNKLHTEIYTISSDTASKINRDVSSGKKVLAVGTTTCRALEASSYDGYVNSGTCSTDIFIYPGYRWKIVDAILTNFHYPKSSLMLMIDSFLGDNLDIIDLYNKAIEEKYMFLSYGDSMLII